MGRVKVIIHPLFFVFGLYFAFLGKVFSFIIFTLTAVIHELGHAFVADRLGYTLNRIVLMPYGALISGDVENLSYKDECLVALGGPMLNAIIGVVFVAVWWFFPETYAYTDTAVIACFSLAVINLIPAYPLDGGRLLLATLSLIVNRKTAVRISKAVGVLLSLGLLGLFIYSAFTKLNITILFFAIFMFIGVVDKSDKNVYIKTYAKFKSQGYDKPRRVKNIILSGNNKIKKLFSLIDGNDYYVFTIVDDNGNRYDLHGDKLYEVISSCNIYQTLNEIIKKD